MYHIEISKEPYIISIVNLDVGKVPQEKADTILANVEKMLIDNGHNAIVIRGYNGTSAIEINSQLFGTSIVSIPVGNMSNAKVEEYLHDINQRINNLTKRNPAVNGNSSLILLADRTDVSITTSIKHTTESNESVVDDSMSVNHAKHELALLGWDKGDELQQAMCQQFIDIVRLFSSHKHSGISGPYSANIIHKLLNHEILSPLTGDDSEWDAVGEDNSGLPMYQNKRMPSVFKCNDKAYWLYGKVFKNKSDGSTYTDGSSSVDITFPWMPPPQEIIEVDE